MEENKTAQPQAENTGGETAGETPQETNAGTIEVKFNKEIKNITAEQAATLAQKGMKFEVIEEDFSRLRNLAAKSNMSIPEYIGELEKQQAKAREEQILNEYKDNGAMARRIAELEQGEKAPDELDELREYFPTVKDLSDLPRAVVETARLKGENLLSTYLKYRLIKKRQKEEEQLFERTAQNASVGPLAGKGAAQDDPFLKALWGK